MSVEIENLKIRRFSSGDSFISGKIEGELYEASVDGGVSRSEAEEILMSQYIFLHKPEDKK